MTLCHFPRSDWNACHMEVFWERGPGSWGMFWSCCDPVDQAGSVYLRVDRAEVGQHEGGNGEKGGNCVKATPLFLSAHLLAFLHTPLIRLQSFWVMSCCGRAVGTPSRRDGIRESLVWVTAGRTCQGKPSGGGSEVSIKLISREERTSVVSNNFSMNLRDSSLQNSARLKASWDAAKALIM